MSPFGAKAQKVENQGSPSIMNYLYRYQYYKGKLHIRIFTVISNTMLFSFFENDLITQT